MKSQQKEKRTKKGEMMEATLYAVREAAKLLTLKESTLYRWIFDKKIHPIRVGTRAVRIPRTEIQRILGE